jgi:3-keto-disaccharide hydrolase
MAPLPLEPTGGVGGPAGASPGAPMFRITVAAITGLTFIGFTSAGRAGEKVITPFNGKDLTGWKLRGDPKKSEWQVGHAVMSESKPAELIMVPDGTGPAQMVDLKRSMDIYTEEKFGDCRIEAELMIPKGSNSGIYVMGEYEVQVLDSYGKEKVGPGDMGGLYNAAAPRVNACKKPGEWQKFVIDFQAPRFENGKKISNAKFLKVVLNDQIIHENVEMKGPTPSCLTGKEAPTGPVMFQGDHGPVAYRSIRITVK